jgi:PmbA protein
MDTRRARERAVMLSKTALLGLCERILDQSTADQTEVVGFSSTTSLTRYANSAIHQSVVEEDTQLHVRAIIGKRVGCASTNDLSPSALADTTDRAIRAARVQEEDPDFVSLPVPLPIPETEGYAAATAACSPQQRADAILQVIETARAHDLSAAGAYSTDVRTIAVANSLGMRAAGRTTRAQLTAVVTSDDSSGYADAEAEDVSAIDARAVASDATERCLRSRRPVEVEPGDWEVVLDFNAVGDMLTILAYIGLGALEFQEGRSFMSGRIGEAVCAAAVSIWDDALAPDTIRMPFDFEGVPKQKVDLIREGVAAGVVYDSYTAAREGRQSTGHALLAPNPHGPMPTNLHMAPGDAADDDMLCGIQRGLLVTRFHYTNVVHPVRTVITGMTRDGTFLVEDGQVVAGVKNLRFTQSVLDALKAVTRVSARRRLAHGCYVPQLLIGRFHFSGRTSF